MQFAYNPHLPPVLRLDPTGAPDKLPELLETARTRPLTAEETRLLADALCQQEPWLEWAGKREKKSFEIEPVALHIHERISTQAILKVAARENVQRSLFADPQQEYREAVQFYQHDVDWSNRMILGDSLQVMASLARREDLAGKVQMIYMDPPYGIKFASNFQPEIGKRDVKDKETDLTREPEMVKAYRDTWTLGVHSYLAYLRDRLWLCKELLADSGSVFVQISDENLHRVRMLMDEVFGPGNFVAVINFRSMMPLASSEIESVYDYVLWYARDSHQMKYRNIWVPKNVGEDSEFVFADTGAGGYRRLSKDEILNINQTLTQEKVFKRSNLSSSGYTQSCTFSITFNGETFDPVQGKSWRTNGQGIKRLIAANRLFKLGAKLYFKLYHNDFGYTSLQNSWSDTIAFEEKTYVVQTTTTVIERCLLMTTDPGDLVLDPTCGSGTTANVAEQWGRRWITIDTSRVALALARQRLLTAKFDYYKLRPVNSEDIKRNPNGPWLPDPSGKIEGPCTFDCKTVPHITLKSIAQNVALDSIFAKHQPILDEKLAALNAALNAVTPELRQRLAMKLMEKEKREGKKSITDADRRRWQLPKVGQTSGLPPSGETPDPRSGWREWEVPFDADEEWPAELKAALEDYRAAWRAKMDEVTACIAANAEPEELVDQPDVLKGVVRVSGPFTMEAVMPAEESLDIDSPIEGTPEELETFKVGQASSLSASGETPDPLSNEPLNAEAYLDKMLRLLRADGVRFPNNKVMKFARLEPCGGEYLHAEGEWHTEDGQTRTVAVSFGPQFGPVTTYQVENALPMASRRGFDDLVFAGFSFDATAQAIIQEDPNPRVRCHLAHIRPDVNMGDLLKEMPNSQIFTVFGLPRTELSETEDGQFVIEMHGVDIYCPVDNTILPTNADKVAAWFLDTDYDGRTFCVTQAFFPDKSAWEKLTKALKAVIDEEQFEALSGTVSLPFSAGKCKRAAVKVIDPRGNEVMAVHRLDKHDKVRS